MSTEALKELAEAEEVDLKGAKSKAEMVTVLKAAKKG